ncbi:BlaR1 peptidase M56 [Symmachiella macrocystis]|uniref:BlaR1 peptidase M56 n=1 Tax=Symmachiella macrocystis TaxID=2527985 RepID=A0A5C6B516_9PLAN|nr:M56 family metallopeptidase [Symmachiella macrocystis]TWU06652.1 BlaR1 peptidase M56 [Symmachiella macrocystis]
MNETLHFLESHGGMLITGASALLVVGGVALLLHRAPINRQRAGELTIVAVMAWMLIACIPLPRFSTNELLPQTPVPPVATQILDQVPIAAPPVPEAIAQDRLAEEDARIHETAEILEQLAQLDAEQPVLPLVDGDLPLNDSPPTFEANVAVVATPMIAPSSPGAALAAEGFSWRQIVAALYLGGAALCIAWVVLGWLLLFRLTRQAISPHGWLRDLYTSLSSDPLPRLLVSSKCRRAFSCGWWRPTIVLPLECCEESRADQLRQILLHELAHLQQGDQRGRVLFNIALPLLYVHPLYWWIRSRTYLAAELVADDWAAGHSSTTAYAGELIALVKEQGRRGMAHVGTVGIFSSPTQFYRRMEMLVRRQTPLMTTCTRRWRLLTTLTAAAAVILLSSTLGVRLVQAEPDDGDKPSETVEAAPETQAKPANPQTPVTVDAPDVGEKQSETVEATPDTDTTPAKHVDDRVRKVFGVSGRTEDDDDESSGRSNRRISFGGGRVSSQRTPEFLLSLIKSKYRDVLIMRLQLINRRATDKEKEIRKLLTDENISDIVLIERLYKNVLNRPVDDAEMAIVQKILMLSDNRGDSIRSMFESMGKLDEAVSAALTVLELEPQLAKMETELRELIEQVDTITADFNPDEEAPDTVRKKIKLSNRSGEEVKSWGDVWRILNEQNDSLAVRTNDLKKEFNELAKLDQELQKQRSTSNLSRYWYGTPKTPSRTGKPAADDSWYAQTQKPQTGATPPKQRTRTVIKRVPVRVARTTPDGRTVYETRIVEKEVVVPEKDTYPQDPQVPTDNPKNVQPYAPSQSDAPTYNAPRPSARQTPVPIPRTPQVPTTQKKIEPIPDSRLPSTHHDVIKLATDYSQTHSELDSAKRTYERVQKLNEKGVVSQAEYEKAAEKLASMRERLKTMQTIAEILRESLEAELNALKLEMNQADKTKDEVRKAQLHTRFTRVSGNLRILKTMK